MRFRFVKKTQAALTKTETAPVMTFQEHPDQILWRVHIAAPRAHVYELIATSEGRRQFWAESAIEDNGVIAFVFPDGTSYMSQIIERRPLQVFAIEYFRSIVVFELTETRSGETDVILRNVSVPPDERTEVIAGWVSVLMQLKAAAQFGVDLRNHCPDRSWRTGYVEN